MTVAELTESEVACPICRGPMQRREAMYFWRGDYRPGIVCPTHGLWPIKGEEIEPLRGEGL